MTLIKMKSSEMGAPNGYDSQIFEEGKEYDLPDSLAVPWIDAGKAMKIKLEPKEEPKEEPKKKAKEAPENKAMKGAPENK